VKKQKTRFILYDKDKKMIASYIPDALPLSENAVRRQCLEIYGEEDVCFTREGAVRLRMIVEIQSVLAGKKSVKADKTGALSYITDSFEYIGYQES
jgi:hypothetical protein